MVHDRRHRTLGMTERRHERRFEGRLDDLDRENVRLRTEVAQLRRDLDHERSLVGDAMKGLRAKPAVVKRSRRAGLVRTAIVGGGAYLLGTRAGRERYDHIMGWVDEKRRELVSRDDGWSGDPAAKPVVGTPTTDHEELQRS